MRVHRTAGVENSSAHQHLTYRQANAAAKLLLVASCPIAQQHRPILQHTGCRVADVRIIPATSRPGRQDRSAGPLPVGTQCAARCGMAPAGFLFALQGTKTTEDKDDWRWQRWVADQGPASDGDQANPILREAETITTEEFGSCEQLGLFELAVGAGVVGCAGLGKVKPVWKSK